MFTYLAQPELILSQAMYQSIQELLGGENKLCRQAALMNKGCRGSVQGTVC